MREPTLIAATIGTAVAALRFQDEFRPGPATITSGVVTSWHFTALDGDCATTLRRTDRTD